MTRKEVLEMKTIDPVMNAVMVQLVDGKPVVGLMLKDEAARPELEKLARKILHVVRQGF